ncbi:MAG: ribonuclease J [Rhodospirillaceae bacterium]|nr:ribonuclease J [Rhodospirillaceae bacterium]
MSWATHDPEEGLVFVPLGGVGQIGMNLYAYGCDGQWLVVDCGITFRDEMAPGVEVLMADPTFLAERKDAICGLILTHAHEDHIGAVPHLWPYLECPIYGTPFTLAMLEGKLKEADLEPPVTVVPVGGTCSCGPFDIRFVALTHSIPEPSALLIKTPYGDLIHSGDWKLDPDPLIVRPVQEDILRDIGDAGVLAVIGDSTNAQISGHSGSEATVYQALVCEIAKCRGRVAVGCFASNAARVESIARAARAAGRDVCLLGRSLHRIVEVSESVGHPLDVGALISESDAGYIPDDRILFIVTGSQGEPRAALARIAANTHPNIRLGEGDTVIFSSRVIPGNERSVLDIQNRLVALGVDILTSRDCPDIHVSGHPAQEELETFYRLLRPDMLVTMHGENLHMEAHAKLAQSVGIQKVIVPFNGVVVRLAPGAPEKVGTVPSGRLALDGVRLIDRDSEILRNRRRIMYNGCVVVTLVVDGKGELPRPPCITAPGLLDAENEGLIADLAVDAAIDAVRQMPVKSRRHDEGLQEAVRRAVRRVLHVQTGKKPVTYVQVFRM